MKKSELKNILKPLIKECIREAIFEEGILSGLITEVVQGLGSNQRSPEVKNIAETQNVEPRRSGEAEKQLNEIKSQLQSAAGLYGVFEGTKPLANKSNSQSSQYGALKDKDPSDPGVNIDGLIKMTGGWKRLK